MTTTAAERRTISLPSLPITFTAIGLIALIGGALLASFSLRTESALAGSRPDHDDDDFGRATQPVPGAEAETEQLPAQPHGEDAESSGADPPPPGPGAATAPDPDPPHEE